MHRRPLPLFPLLLALAACAPRAGLPAPSVPAALRVDSLRTAALAPGVRHHYLWDAAGPWAIHVVEADLRACGVALRTLKANDRLVGRATTSAMAREAEARWGRPVLAAVNADFFSFSPPGVPVGAQVMDGEIVKGPAARPVFGITAEGEPFIAEAWLSGEVRTPDGYAAPLRGVNTPPGRDALALYNRFIGEATPADTGAAEARLRVLAPARLPGDTAAAVVLALDTLPAGVALGAGEAVLAGRGRGAVFLRGLVAPGDTLRWWAGFDGVPGTPREMVGGFPRLLAGGEPVHHVDPAVRPPFGEARHPRTAVGWRPDGTLLLVTVDGRQEPYSAGMSLAELASLFRRLGATEALNLDGGGSTAMVVRGQVVNRPSDREGERANANALLLLGPAEGACTGG